MHIPQDIPISDFEKEISSTALNSAASPSHTIKFSKAAAMPGKVFMSLTQSLISIEFFCESSLLACYED